ncbi:CgeB family protein [Caminicella sporogenes]|uniref:CgeB family protein n=1 Tax=Caminicella sporogenes TaxID=166485 RepID=UPI00254193DD|nr:glycosyltransferase [Caminicella sporogenes]WIF96089.1 glycosyltransferase [Caminicella sporogenes]
MENKEKDKKFVKKKCGEEEMINYNEFVNKERNLLKKIMSQSRLFEYDNYKIDLDKIKYKSKNVFVQNGNLIITSSNKHEYIPLFSDNLNFSNNKSNQKIYVYPMNKYISQLQCEAIGNVNFELHIIGFDKDDNRIDKEHYIVNNTKQQLTFSTNVFSVKFFIRVSGEGLLKNILFTFKPDSKVKNELNNAEVCIFQPQEDTKFDEEEYQLSTYLLISEFNKEILFTNNEAFNISGNKIIANGLAKSDYISLYEKNCNFNALPKDNIINMDPDYNYYISFDGKKDLDLSVQLFLIFYSDNKKIEVDSLFLNQKKTITPLNNAKFLRLALRIEGNGKITLDKITIKRKKKLGFLSYNNLKKLGFDNPTTIKDLKIACIFDEFTTECYKDMCRLIKIKPDTWKAQLSIEKPHLLFVESAWVGNDGAWTGKVAYKNENNIKELRELINWCKRNGIPTIFWNKEDPVHFNVFINTARYFDYIFTTDEDSIKNYIEHVKHERVYALPFAAQPKIHNPINEIERSDKACFAGSYYATKYEERQKDIDRLLDASVETIGIDIYDRKYGLNDKDFIFPERFRPYIKGKLEPSELYIANKGYKVMLNVNSVKYSPTMFSRRVFEGLACGTPVVSSYSEGILEMFDDLVLASDDYEEIKEELIKLGTDDVYYEKKSIKSVRTILEKHTYLDRLEFVCKKVGLNIKNTKPYLNIVSFISKKEDYEKILEIYKKQNYPNKKLMVLIEEYDSSYIDLVNTETKEDIEFIFIGVFKDNKLTLNKIFKCDYIGLIDINNYYSANYFNDLMLATLYTDAEIIGRKTYFSNKTGQVQVVNDGYENCYVSSIDLDKSIISSKLFTKYSINDLKNIIKNKDTHNLFKAGIRMYSINKYNYLESSQGVTKDELNNITG